MTILALEFSSNLRSVAVAAVREQGSESTRVLAHHSDEGMGGWRPLAAIDRLVREAGLEREGIEQIAVGLGPGSYTGIRAAISVAQGWQLARGIRLTGISSMVCMAARAHALGWLGDLILVVDAQRNDLYVARYRLDSAGFQESAGLRLASVEELRASLAESSGRDDGPAREGNGILIAGPEANSWFADAKIIHPDAATLAQLASLAPHGIAGEELEPIYLRPAGFVKAPPPRPMLL
jgi:tRNA threonylcarbamoyladenosine biosynthesis protein TsaB